MSPRSTRQLADLFAIDYRGMAVFRIVVAAVAVTKAISGILSQPTISLAASWNWWLMLAAACLLAVGRLKSIAAFVIWLVLCCSFATSVGNYLTIIATMWCVFLPVDRFLTWPRQAHDRETPQAKSYLSLATAAILLQVFFIYVQAGMSKNWNEWLIQASAIHDLSYTHYVSPVGRWLLDWPLVPQLLSILTIAIEVLVPIALFIPGKRLKTVRMLGAFLMIAMHLGMIFTMTLETIPVISIAFWFLFVPSEYWDRIWPAAGEQQTCVEPERLCNRMAMPLFVTMLISVTLSWMWPMDPTDTLCKFQNCIPKVGLYQEWRMFASPATLRRNEAEQNADDAVNSNQG